MLFLKTLLFFAIIWLIRFIIEKDNFKRSQRLNDIFKKWIESDEESERPNSAEFVELFDIAYKSSISKDVIKDDSEMTKNISSSQFKQHFPISYGTFKTLDEEALEHINDYFSKRYKENFSLSFWIKFYIFLPAHFVKLLGFSEKSLTSKALNCIYWLIGAFFLFIKPIVLGFINHLLR